MKITSPSLKTPFRGVETINKTNTNLSSSKKPSFVSIIGGNSNISNENKIIFNKNFNNIKFSSTTKNNQNSNNLLNNNYKIDNNLKESNYDQNQLKENTGNKNTKKIIILKK